MRYGPDDPAPRLQQNDIILGNGDIILIESRSGDLLYRRVAGGRPAPDPPRL